MYVRNNQLDVPGTGPTPTESVCCWVTDPGAPEFGETATWCRGTVGVRPVQGWLAQHDRSGTSE